MPRSKDMGRRARTTQLLLFAIEPRDDAGRKRERLAELQARHSALSLLIVKARRDLVIATAADTTLKQPRTRLLLERLGSLRRERMQIEMRERSERRATDGRAAHVRLN